MAKALVIIGYHYGELEWGRKVKDSYTAKNLKGNRGIEFYEIKHSGVRQGLKSPGSESEIKKLIRKRQDVKLIIDLHCGFLKPEYKGRWPERLRKMKPGRRYLLFYQSDNPMFIEKIKRYDRNIMINSPLQTHRNAYGIPLAAIDFFFTAESYRKKNKIFQKAVRKAISFINDMYDLHC